VISAGDGADLTGRDWRRLDSELIQRCRQARVKPPLKERASSPEEWDLLVKEVTSEQDFKVFLDAIFGHNRCPRGQAGNAKLPVARLGLPPSTIGAQFLYAQ
jgi:hypothetical protein